MDTVHQPPLARSWWPEHDTHTHSGTPSIHSSLFGHHTLPYTLLPPIHIPPINLPYHAQPTINPIRTPITSTALSNHVIPPIQVGWSETHKSMFHPPFETHHALTPSPTLSPDQRLPGRSCPKHHHGREHEKDVDVDVDLDGEVEYEYEGEDELQDTALETTTQGASGRKGIKRKMKYQRVRTGCLSCRVRRVKCGEERPTCRKCVSSGWGVSLFLL